jgi:hypothetical protein
MRLLKLEANYYNGPKLVVDNGKSRDVVEWLKKNDYREWLGKLRRMKV